MPISEVAPSPTLASRVTPRSSPPKWGSPKVYKRHYKEGTRFPISPSASLRPSDLRGKKAAKSSPKSLIERLSDSPLALGGKAVTSPSPSGVPRPPESPTRLLERLMKSEVLSTMLSQRPNTAMYTSVVQEPPATADNMMEDGAITTITTHTDVEKSLRRDSPISLADIDDSEVISMGGDLVTVKQEIPTTDPASLMNGLPPAASPISENASAPLYEECKRLVVQLVMQNAQAREPDADIAAQSESLEKQIAVLVTDECCTDFIATAKQIQMQMAAKDSSVEETTNSQNGDSVVGVKRRRDEVDEVEPESPSRTRVRVESDMSGPVEVDSAVSWGPSFPYPEKPTPRAPKAMIKKRQMNKITSIAPSSSYDIPTLIPSTRNDIHVRSNSQHEIPIPSDDKYFKPPASPDRRDPYSDMDRKGHHGRDSDERSMDINRGRKDSRNSDLGTGREKRASDIRSMEIISRRESRYAESLSGRSERRGRIRDDLDDRQDYNDKPHNLCSNSRKRSSAKPDHRTSDDLIATRMSAPEMSAPPNIRPRKSLSIIPACPVPGLWFVKVGLEQADILDVEFNNSPELAKRYHRDGIDFHLLCLPTNLVRETLEQLDQSASPDEVTDAMWNIKVQWPPQGKLLIEVNPGDAVGRNWLPCELDTGLPLNLTMHIRHGPNNIRLIHLGDLSGHIFMLHAAASCPSRLNFPLDQPLNAKYLLTQDLINSDRDPDACQLKAKTGQDLDTCAATFKFSGNVTQDDL